MFGTPTLRLKRVDGVSIAGNISVQGIIKQLSYSADQALIYLKATTHEGRSLHSFTLASLYNHPVLNIQCVAFEGHAQTLQPCTLQRWHSTGGGLITHLGTLSDRAHHSGAPSLCILDNHQMKQNLQSYGGTIQSWIQCSLRLRF